MSNLAYRLYLIFICRKMIIVNPGEAEGASSGLLKHEEGQTHTTSEQWAELCLELSLILLSTRGKSCLRTSTNAKMPSCGPSHVAQAGIQLAMHWGVFNWPHTSLVLGSQACASVLSCPNAEDRALGLPPCAQASVQQTHAPSPRKTFLTQPQKWVMAKGHHISPTWQTTLTLPLQSPRHRFPDKNWKNKVEGKVHKLLQSQQTRVGLGTSGSSLAQRISILPIASKDF